MRTSVEALVHATRSMTTNYSNWCLKYVRQAYAVGPKYASAIDAWNGAKRRHRSLANAPEGAPVFFSHPKSRYGHVAMLDMINGVPHIRTTNSAVGRPVTQPISLWTDRYGYRLLGWTEDLNGVVVAKPVPKPAPKPAPQPSPPSQGGLKSARKTYYVVGDYGYEEVAELQRVLNRWYPGLPPLTVDGNYGPKTADRVAYLQKKARGKAGPVDSSAGNLVLRFLGIR